jgi:hypothetical protein
MSNILPFLPDFVTIALAVLVFIIVYHYMPDEAKKKSKMFLWEYGVFVVLFILWLYFRNQWGLVYEHPEAWPGNIRRATFFFGFGALLYFAVKSWLYEFRYYTNHAIADNRSGSCHRFQEVGSTGEGNNWVILFIGGSGTSDHKFVFPWPWAHEIWVVPKTACQFIGNQILVKSQINKVDILDVPEEVNEFIENDTFAKFAKDYIFFGLWDAEIRATNPNVQIIESNVEKLNSRINELKEMLRGKLSVVRSFVSDTMAMQDRLKGKSRFGGQQQQGAPQSE